MARNLKNMENEKTKTLYDLEYGEKTEKKKRIKRNTNTV
jgi:hypothetical protein